MIFNVANISAYSHEKKFVAECNTVSRNIKWKTKRCYVLSVAQYVL